MGLLDSLGGILQQVSSGNATPDQVHDAYDKVAAAAPAGDLASGLAHVFNSDKTPAFDQMVGGLFGQSNGEQKAGMLNQILGALGPAGVTAALGSAGGLGGLASVLAGGSVTPQQAQSIPPDAVQVLAKHASQKDPSIVDVAANFYAQHPTLVKSIGAGALALLMSRISASR